jgi:hypothetical protein
MEKHVSFMEGDADVCELLSKDETIVATDPKAQGVIEISLPGPLATDQRSDERPQRQYTGGDDTITAVNNDNTKKMKIVRMTPLIS